MAASRNMWGLRSSRPRVYDGNRPACGDCRVRWRKHFAERFSAWKAAFGLFSVWCPCTKISWTAGTNRRTLPLVPPWLGTVSAPSTSTRANGKPRYGTRVLAGVEVAVWQGNTMFNGTPGDWARHLKIELDSCQSPEIWAGKNYLQYLVGNTTSKSTFTLTYRIYYLALLGRSFSPSHPFPHGPVPKELSYLDPTIVHLQRAFLVHVGCLSALPRLPRPEYVLVDAKLVCSKPHFASN
ncbi:hypothetical protein B0T26DRAFT_180060 [Lasiosphaeria miniovina]|uniref:Uncharacterized protein n=1 Tax=Lasiosphaeria miniovina TaxID=1954250 RepID=A0AA40B6L3_9PEZI|nr:uncharacterized protein B0T26DRAFT_180060 [Lasiosphaeria miniovina]KAK0728635.1 hypothetical protein B0T26DRAFT_180060 [Lasiosphaeria miniovina]